MGIRRVWDMIRKEQSNIREGENHDSYMNGYYYGLDCALYIIAEEYPEVVRKKSDDSQIVPFDFSEQEDRDDLRNRWIISKETGSEARIQSFTKASNGFWTVDFFIDGNWISAVSSALFENYVFADTGLPVGKEVE